MSIVFFFFLIGDISTMNNESTEAVKVEVGKLVTLLDEALGSPPFDHPNDLTISAAEELRLLLTKLEKASLIDSLKDLKEVNYDLPVLCAALPLGSKSEMCLPLYRCLLESLICTAPILKYPFAGIIQHAKSTLEYEDSVLFRLLVVSKSLEKEDLRKFLKLPEHVPAKPLKESKGKSGKQSKGSVPSHVSEVERTIPRGLLMLIIGTPMEPPLQSLVATLVDSPEKFRQTVKNDAEMAEMWFKFYRSCLLEKIIPTVLLPVLTKVLWPFFVELCARAYSVKLLAKTIPAVNVEWSVDQWVEIVQFSSPLPHTQTPRGNFTASLLIFQAFMGSTSAFSSEVVELKETLLYRVFLQAVEFIRFDELVKSKENCSSSGEWFLILDNGLASLLTKECEEGTYRCLKSPAAEAGDTLRKLLRKKFIELVKQKVEGPPILQGKNSKGKKGKDVPQKAGKQNGTSKKNERQESHSDWKCTEEVLHHFTCILFVLDCLLSEGVEETLVLWQEAFTAYRSQQKDGQPMASTTFQLLLRHIELLGSRMCSPTAAKGKLSASLPALIARASLITGNTRWAVPFLSFPLSLPTKEWWSVWSPSLLFDILSLVHKKPGDPHVFAIAGLLFQALNEQQLNGVCSLLKSAKDLHLWHQCLVMNDNTLVSFKQSFSMFISTEETQKEAIVGLEKLKRYVDEQFSEAIQQEEMLANREKEKLAEQVQQQVEMENLLAEKDKLLKKKMEEKATKYALEQQKLKEQIETEKKQKQEKHEEIVKQRAREKKSTMDTARKMQKLDAEKRLIERRKRLEAYKEASLRNFKAASFLHYLGVPTSKVLVILREVVEKSPNIAPDDLLEYLVTGSARIPLDLIQAMDTSEANEDDDWENARKDAILLPRKAFWKDVLENGTDAVPKEKPAKSFHLRVKVFLDLFCYEGGNEYGALPKFSPRVSIPLAKMLLSAKELQNSEFDSVDNAFHAMMLRGLIKVADNTATLTKLGFHYHFPFHTAEKMLSVRVQLQKQKALALMRIRREAANGPAEQSSPSSNTSKEEEVFGEEIDEEWECFSEEGEDEVV